MSHSYRKVKALSDYSSRPSGEKGFTLTPPPRVGQGETGSPHELDGSGLPRYPTAYDDEVEYVPGDIDWGSLLSRLARQFAAAAALVGWLVVFGLFLAYMLLWLVR